MCQVLIGKIVSGEMRVFVMQLSSSRLTYRHSEAHRRAAVLVRPSIESEIVADQSGAGSRDTENRPQRPTGGSDYGTFAQLAGSAFA